MEAEEVQEKVCRLNQEVGAATGLGLVSQQEVGQVLQPEFMGQTFLLADALGKALN